MGLLERTSSAINPSTIAGMGLRRSARSSGEYEVTKRGPLAVAMTASSAATDCT
jgi:hypothetical protein